MHAISGLNSAFALFGIQGHPVRSPCIDISLIHCLMRTVMQLAIRSISRVHVAADRCRLFSSAAVALRVEKHSGERLPFPVRSSVLCKSDWRGSVRHPTQADLKIQAHCNYAYCLPKRNHRSDSFELTKYGQTLESSRRRKVLCAPSDSGISGNRTYFQIHARHGEWSNEWSNWSKSDGMTRGSV